MNAFDNENLFDQPKPPTVIPGWPLITLIVGLIAISCAAYGGRLIAESLYLTALRLPVGVLVLLATAPLVVGVVAYLRKVPLVDTLIAAALTAVVVVGLEMVVAALPLTLVLTILIIQAPWRK